MQILNMPFLQAKEVDLIPREVLFGNPVKASPQISPDGKMLAYLAPVNNVLNVWVRTIGQNDDRAVTNDANRGIRTYGWAQDKQHLFYVQDVGGNENWRLYTVDYKTKEVKDLTPFENVQVRIVDVDKHHPHEALLSMNKENPQVHDVYHLDLSTGALTMIAKNPGDFSGWFTDNDFRVLGASRSRPDGGTDILIRDSESADWKNIISFSMEDSESGVISFTKDNKQLYLRDSRDFNASRLVLLDLATNSKKILAEDPNYDISETSLHPDTRELQYYTFYKDKNEYHFVDKEIGADFKLFSKLSKGEPYVVNRDNDDEKWLVAFTIDDGAAKYYFYDRKTKRAEFLFENRPDLNRYALSPMEPISYKTRDGLTVHGYITFPSGQKKNLPMVLNVHGGPWVRDGWGYDPEAQWLANRGYICLQVNYRGSSGYGKAFLNAGNKEWGGKMHEDLVDAVEWAVKKGYADPKRVAIFGGSYGGYAALVGATFTPDLFKCAVDVVGPSNLLTFMETIPPYWSVYLAEFHKRVGDPETETEFLKSRSPLFKVDKIKIPLLIAQGANDPRVNQAEAEQIVEALKKKNLPYEYMLFPDEGHGFAKPENRIKFYAAAEKFLAAHLGGRAEKEKQAAKTIYAFRMKTIDGAEKSLADYKGKALLIVNTASKCGFTPQYAGLERLYEKYKSRGFEILAFPANNFMGQEPGTNAEIKEFCSLKFKTTFPLFAKISVKGKDIDPLYSYLTTESGFEGNIKWNFNKFLVNPQGQVVARYDSSTDPMAPELISDLEGVLPVN